jgi:hypothetical protein
VSKPEAAYRRFSLWIVGDAPLLYDSFSLGSFAEGEYGLPAPALKRAFVATRDNKRVLEGALWFDAKLVPTLDRPRLARLESYGVEVEPQVSRPMPFVRIYGSPPGTQKLYRRPEPLIAFEWWAVRVSGRYDATRFDKHDLTALISDAGAKTGLGHYRPQHGGRYGSFHVAHFLEADEWEAFAAGTGPLPTSQP